MLREPTETRLFPGFATREGTRRFADRQPCASDHFARPDDLWLSSIGLGTLRGEPGGVDDLLYRSIVSDFIAASGNVFNTALSDRMQTSERALGNALRRVFRESGEDFESAEERESGKTSGTRAANRPGCRRDEVVVVSKGGALTPDPQFAGSYTMVQRDLYETYIDSGLIDPSEVIRGHCLSPRFLLDQIQRSRRNLGLETIDYYLLQEPEILLRKLGADAFRSLMQEAFEALEQAVERGWIRAYGISSWDGFLLPDSDRSHLSIVDLFQIALDVGQADHHLRAIQLPYGLAMGEGAALDSQLGPDGHSRALLESLRDTGTVVFASAPLYGGRLVGRIPGFVREAFPEATSDASAALQFVRSTANVTTAITGMRDPEHLEDNMRLARIPRADPSLPRRLFAAAARAASAGA
jgi:aryl-alcohol dehydrogenase-like predicted oxidoreductase